MIDLSKLNNEQKIAVTTTEGPLLIIAGAGSGKTTVLINRLAYLVDKGIPAESILMVTFTNKAADNMINRAAAMSNEECRNVKAMTYHSFCAEMLRKYGKYINWPNNYTILSEPDVIEAIKFTKAKKDAYKDKSFPKNKILNEIFSKSINKCASIEEILKSEEKYNKYLIFKTEIQNLFEEYTLYKEERYLCSYDDLLLKLLALLNTKEGFNSISKKFKYIMVDEYQDSNNLQEKIILKLTTYNKNIAVVGDDYQSIYRFRCANVNNIIDFEKKFDNCKKIILDTNYRSTPEIINLANNVMNKHANFGFKKDMNTPNISGSIPLVIAPKSGFEEANNILSMINKYLSTGAKYKDIAILERNSASSYNLERLLNQEGLPFEKFGGLSFMDHAAVLDILAYFKLITNPYDELSWFRILQLHPGIGDTYARNLAKLCENPKFLQENKYSKKEFYKELKILEDFILEMKTLSGQDKTFKLKLQIKKILEFYTKLRKRVIDNMECQTEEKRSEYYQQLKNDMETVSYFLELSEKYTKLNEIVDALTLRKENGDDSENNKDTLENGKITISTIHSAKGLEWDHVILLDAIEGIIPNPVEEDEAIAEDLRCFYVAITRAKKTLRIYCPNEIIKNGGLMSGIATRFINGNSPEIMGYNEIGNVIHYREQR